MSAAFQCGLGGPGPIQSRPQPPEVIFEVCEAPPPASLGLSLTGYLLEALLRHPGPAPQRRF